MTTPHEKIRALLETALSRQGISQVERHWVEPVAAALAALDDAERESTELQQEIDDTVDILVKRDAQLAEAEKERERLDTLENMPWAATVKSWRVDPYNGVSRSTRTSTGYSPTVRDAIDDYTARSAEPETEKTSDE